MSTPIVLRRDRDFGQVFNAATAFIQQHLKPLALHVLLVISPFLVLSTLISLVFVGMVPFMFESPFDAVDDPFTLGAGFYGAVVVVWMLQIAMIVGIQTVVFAYLAQYERRSAQGEYGPVPSDAVWALSKRQWGRQFLFSLIYLLVFVIFVIPCIGWVGGIYLWVAMALGAPMLMHESVGVQEAVSRSMKIIKGSWWQTFGLLFLAGIVSWVIMLGLSLPSILLSGFGFITGDVGEVGPVMVVVTSIVSFVTGLFTNVVYLIPLVVTAFQYYNLAEDHGQAGLRDRVAQYAAAASPEQPAPPFAAGDVPASAAPNASEAAPADSEPEAPPTAATPDAARWAPTTTPSPAPPADADRWAPKPPSASTGTPGPADEADRTDAP